MPETYSVRAARPRDVPTLPGIELRAATLFTDEDLPPELRHDATPESAFEAAAAEGRLWVAVSERDDTPIGFALARVVDGTAHLHELDVDPDHGRQGLGARLIGCLVAWARARGDQEITLTTFRHVAWNAPYYARIGFELVPAADIGAELRELMQREVEAGLDPNKRVAMRMRIAPA